MTMTKSLERKLDEILERYRLLHWKKAGLKELIIYAQVEKKYWKNSNKTHLINDMTRIIRMAQILTKAKRSS